MTSPFYTLEVFMNAINTPIRSQKTEMAIGNTTFIIITHFKENARENAEQKLLRFVSDQIANEMKQPQNLVI